MQLINKYKTKTIGREKNLSASPLYTDGCRIGRQNEHKCVWNRGQVQPKEKGDCEARTMNQ